MRGGVIGNMGGSRIDKSIKKITPRGLETLCKGSIPFCATKIKKNMKKAILKIRTFLYQMYADFIYLQMKSALDIEAFFGKSLSAFDFWVMLGINLDEKAKRYDIYLN